MRECRNVTEDWSWKMCYSWLQVSRWVHGPKERCCREMDEFCCWRFALTSPPLVLLRTAVYAELSVHQKPPKIRTRNCTNVNRSWEWSVSQDPGSRIKLIHHLLQRPGMKGPALFGKSTKLSQRTKQGRVMVFRFRCWLKEHEANRLPGYAEVQICVSQGVQECPCWISRDV